MRKRNRQNPPPDEKTGADTNQGTDSKPSAWTVYILECADRTLYTGITNNLARRIADHESGKGAKYTRGRAPFTLIHSESLATRSLALKREAEIKSFDKAAKWQLAIK